MNPFIVDIPQAELDDLRDRIARTRWGGDFGGDSWAYGTNGVYLRELADYWLERYDWRRTEAQINAIPAYTAEVNGLSIHFQLVRGKDGWRIASVVWDVETPDRPIPPERLSR